MAAFVISPQDRSSKDHVVEAEFPRVLLADLAAGGRNAVAYVFDLLFLDGRDLHALPLGDRRKALEKLIGNGP